MSMAVRSAWHCAFLVRLNINHPTVKARLEPSKPSPDRNFMTCANAKINGPSGGPIKNRVYPDILLGMPYFNRAAYISISYADLFGPRSAVDNIYIYVFPCFGE